MEHENILRWFQATAEDRGKEACFRFKKNNRWNILTWKEVLAQVILLSEALKKNGVGVGDRVAILSPIRYEWPLYDAAIMSLGAVTVPIYQSEIPEDVGFILKDTQTQALVVEDFTQLNKVLRVRSHLPDLKRIILLEGRFEGEDVVTHEDFYNSEKGTESDFNSRIRKIKGDQLASIVYTSGTSGKPKGVMLTHENFLAEEKALMDRIRLKQEDTVLGFLPLAHILGRILQWYQLTQGFECAYAESVEKLQENILEVQPHTVACVPRVFEKIFNNVMAKVQAGSVFKKWIFDFGVRTGLAYSRCIQRKQPVSIKEKIKHAMALKLVFSKLHKKLGGRIRFFISGGAPLSRNLCEFFHGAGLLILEGYGLTETTGAINVNSPEDYNFGSVGKPLRGVEEKIAENGEVLVRGPMVARGYWGRPNATADAFDTDGWFHTGDIGEFDKRGFLRITGRLKDIIVTSGGKNISPQNIENLIQTYPLISQVVIHGDKRKFLSALITLDSEELIKKAAELGLVSRNPSTLAKDPKILEIVQSIIEEINNKLASYQTIKKFAVLDRNFSVERGELTPSLKVKRKVIYELFQSLFDAFYEKSNDDLLPTMDKSRTALTDIPPLKKELRLS